MLVLSRKKGQNIVADGNVKVSILDIRGNTVKIGVQAPKDVRILRGELEDWQEPSVPAATPSEQASENWIAANL